MNERIRQLADIAYKNHMERNPHSSFGRRYDYDKEFAELIVKECARVANDSNQSKNRAVGVSVGDVVREHFGVAE